MNNLKLYLKKNQAQKQNKLPDSFCNDPEKFIQENFSEATKRLLNNIIYFCSKYRQVSPAQATLGLHSSITRRHVNRLVGMLEEWGFISTTYRHRTTSIYRVSEYFKNHAITFRLRHLFPALKLPLLIMLSSSINTGVLSKNVSPIKVNLSLSVIVSQGTSRLSIHSQDTKRIVRPFASQLTNGWSEKFKNLIQGKVIMNETISPVILGIKSLNLTKRGQISLMAYADQVIKWADPVMQRRGNKGDNFNYFNKLCLIRSKELGLIPDWQIVTKLLTFHKVSVNESPLENLNVNPVAQPPEEQPTFKQFNKNSLKQESPRKVQSWKPSEERSYGPMRIESYGYNHHDPEKTGIAEQSVEFGKKQQERWAQEKQIDRTKQFKSGCALDHEKEIEILFSGKGVENLQKQCMVWGEDVAKNFFLRMVESHKECHRTNHSDQGVVRERPPLVTTVIENVKKEAAVDPSWDNLDLYAQPDNYEETDFILDVDMA